MSNFLCRTSPWPLLYGSLLTFVRIVGFPGVDGAIDGTHVYIIAPTVNEET